MSEGKLFHMGYARFTQPDPEARAHVSKVGVASGYTMYQ